MNYFNFRVIRTFKGNKAPATNSLHKEYQLCLKDVSFTWIYKIFLILIPQSSQIPSCVISFSSFALAADTCIHVSCYLLILDRYK